MAITWTITKNTATNVVRYECTGTNPIDLNQVVIDDYVNIFGNGFNVNNRGSFGIVNVEVFYVGLTLHQAFEIINPLGVPETAIQNAQEEVLFFRPLTNTIAAGERTVVVSSTVEGLLEVSIPATTQAVSRAIKTGAYPHDNEAVSLLRVNRDKNGVTTAFYSGSPTPAFAVGDTFYLEELEPTPSEYFRSLGVLGTYSVSDSTTDAATVDNVNTLLEIPMAFDNGRRNFDIIKAQNGFGLIVGGSTLVAGVPTIDGRVLRFEPVSSAIVSNATLADGATRYTYDWPFPGGASGNGTEFNRAANITVGPAIGQTMINGGAFITLGNYSTSAVTFGSSRKFDPVTATNTASGFDPQPFCGHTLTTLVDGRIISYGGGECVGNTLAGRNSFAGYIWNPGTQSWPAIGFNDIATFDRRAHHAAVELQDKKILFIGGLEGAKGHNVDASTLAYWTCSELVGTTVADSSGNGYNLTTSGTTAGVQGAKIDNGREFTQVGAYATGAGDAAAAAALVGEWTVEWWSCGATGVYPGGMTLSGLGVGAIIAYGTQPSGDGVTADNILMECGFTGDGDIYFMWETGAGSQRYGETPVTGHVVDHYNHFAVRKTIPPASDAVVEFFVNGHKIGTHAGITNAFDGTNSQWYMAHSMDAGFGTGSLTTGAPQFTGVIDNVVVTKHPRSDAQILMDYWEGSPSLPTSAGNRQHRIGRCLERCETFDPLAPILTSVERAPSMGVGRAFHTGTLLPDGRVFVMGGLSHDPSNMAKALYDAGATTLFGCSVSTNSSEFYDHNTKQWTKGPDFLIRRYNHSAIYVPSRDQVLIIGGKSTQGDDVKFIEFLDIPTMKTGVLSEKLFYQAGGAILLDNNTILVATDEPDGAGGLRRIHQLISLESPGLSSKGLADYHTITEVGAGYFKFNTPAAKYYFSNFSKPNKDNPNSFTVTTGARTSNVTTLTLGAAHQFIVGENVYVNLNNTGLFGSGLKTLTAVTATTISYAEIAANQGSTAINGQVFKNFSPNLNVTSWTAQPDTSIPGPYLLDPIEGVSISNIETTIGGSLYTGIFKGQKYTTLPIVDASIFPDEEGFIVLGFGTKLQTIPIKYFGRYNNEGLLIDYNYTFQDTIPTGTGVILLSQRDPFVPDEPIGELYVTASPAGRVAAEKTVDEIHAAGIDLDVKIVYPGDRGLGGEGLPQKGAVKLSDKVAVWGGDDLDNEIKTLKEDT